MEPAPLVVSLLLLAFSTGLIVSHVRTRNEERNTLDPDSGPGRFARRRFRRRMQASIMIGVTGVAILVGQWLPEGPLLFVCYWLGLVLWVLWIALLALADMVATQHHFGNLQRDQIIEQARLQAELDRLERRDNGHSREARQQQERAGDN